MSMQSDLAEVVRKMHAFENMDGTAKQLNASVGDASHSAYIFINRHHAKLQAMAMDAERLREVESMAACMDYVCDELVRAEIIGAEVPPMFYPEVIAKIARKLDALQAMIDNAPRAIMDTRVALGLCAPTEADLPELYALQGKIIALVNLE